MADRLQVVAIYSLTACDKMDGCPFWRLGVDLSFLRQFSRLSPIRLNEQNSESERTEKGARKLFSQLIRKK